ncbi:MAG: hypothetical protein IKQ44_02155 [Lachnospiraceae bacterium]|nr:hypothetical protein [Lachnospiraceae bacterium]
MKIKIKKSDLIWNYIGTFMGMFGNFLILPVLLLRLGADEYGLWNIYLSVGGITTLFDFGFNVTFARNITYCWSGAERLDYNKVDSVENGSVNFELFNEILNTCKRVYCIISTTAAFLIGSIGTVYILKISSGLNMLMVSASWAIYVFAIFLNVLYGYYDSFLRGVGDIEGINRVRVISKAIHVLVAVGLLISGLGIVGASIGYLVHGLVFRIGAKKRFYRYSDIGNRLEHYKTKHKKINTNIINVVWHNAWREGMVQSADYLCNHITVIIVSFYCSLSETGAYSLAVQLTQAIVMVSAVIYNAYQPEIQSSYVVRDFKNIKKILSIILVSLVCITSLGGAVLILIGVPAIRFLRPTAALNSTLILLVLFYQLLLRLRNCYTSYLAATNRIIYAKSFLASGILTIILSIVINELFHIGIWGIVISQIAAQLAYNLWRWPIMVHKELNLSIKDILNELSVKNH